MLETIDSFEIENLMLSADENGIVQVVLSRAKKRNALNAQTIEELIEVFSRHSSPFKKIGFSLSNFLPVYS